MARFSPDGQLIAAASGRSVRLWDAATGRLVRELPAGEKGLISSVAFSPTDNRLLAVGYGGAADISYVTLWDIDAGTELARLPGATDLPDFQGTKTTRWSAFCAFSPDGKYLVAGFGSKNLLVGGSFPTPLKVWEVATRRLIRRLNGHTNYCVSLDFSRDGTLLASGSRDGTAILWSTATWKATQTLQNPDQETRLPPRRGTGHGRGRGLFARTARPWPWPVARRPCSCGTSPPESSWKRSRGIPVRSMPWRFRRMAAPWRRAVATRRFASGMSRRGAN